MDVLADEKMCDKGLGQDVGKPQRGRHFWANRWRRQKARTAFKMGAMLGRMVEPENGKDIPDGQAAPSRPVVESQPAVRGRHYWRNRARRQRQRAFMRRLKDSRLGRSNWPALRWVPSPRRDDVGFCFGDARQVKEEAWDGKDLGAGVLGEESNGFVCREGAEVGPALVRGQVGGERNDVLSDGLSWLAELSDSKVALFGDEADLCDWMELPDFVDFGHFDVKQEP